MNQDNVIRMAREVIEERGGSWVDDADDLIAYSIQLAALVAAHERESLAAEAEKNGNEILAMQIRAWGDTK